METTRLDRWLWAVRLYRTRSSSTEACRAGHIRVNGSPARPATAVHVGDRVEGFMHGRQRVLEVVGLIDKRVGAPVASQCLLDHSPPPPAAQQLTAVSARPAGSGRPTKRDRRQLDRFRLN